MKKYLYVFVIVLISLPAIGADNAQFSPHGYSQKLSPHSVEVTIVRFESAVIKRGMKNFPRIDHAAAAAESGLNLRPTVVLSFGNPKYGTPIMEKNQIAGIDFPPKAIVYQDNEDKVWIGYNTSGYLYSTIFSRHNLTYKQDEVLFYTQVLEELTDYAVAPNN